MVKPPTKKGRGSLFHGRHGRHCLSIIFYTTPSPRLGQLFPLPKFQSSRQKKLPPHAGTKKTAPYNRAKQLHKIKNSSFAPVTSVKKFVLSPSFASLLDPPESPMNPAKINKKTKKETVACLLLLHKVSKTTLISFLLKRRSTFPRSRSSFFLRRAKRPESQRHFLSAPIFFCCLHFPLKPDIVRPLRQSAPCPPIQTP